MTDRTLAAATIVAIATGTACAQFTGPIASVTVSNAQGTGTFTFDASNPDVSITAFGDTVIFQLNAPVTVFDDATGTVALGQFNTITGALVPSQPSAPIGSMASYGLLTQVDVFAGASDTTFNFAVNDLLLSNPLMNAVVDVAGGGFTATDSNGNGVSTSGLFGSDFIRHQLNGLTFADIVSGPVSSATPSDTVNADENIFSQAYGPLVSSLSTDWDFTLSAGDQLAGIANLRVTGKVIPTPAGAALLALGGFVTARRRRH